jgi:hypothetical protein
LDNGVLSCENPTRLQELCDSLDSCQWPTELSHFWPLILSHFSREKSLIQL